MEKIKICFDNDNHELEIDNKTIECIPFLQSYCSFNDKSEKSNIIKLDCTTYDEFKMILDSTIEKKINLVDWIQKGCMSSLFDHMDYFGIISNDISSVYMDYVMDRIKSELLNDNIHRQIFEVQKFLTDKSEKLLLLDKPLFDKLMPKMLKYENIIPFYALNGNIFVGTIPIPIFLKTTRECPMSIIMKNNLMNLTMDKDLVMNKLFFVSVCLGLAKNYTIDFNCLDSGDVIEYITKNTENMNDIGSDVVQFTLNNLKTICEILIEKKDCAQCIKYIFEKFGTIDGHTLITIVFNYRKLINICKKQFEDFNDSFFCMTEKDIEILNNRDKYIEIYKNYCNNNNQLNYGFLKLN